MQRPIRGSNGSVLHRRALLLGAVAAGIAGSPAASAEQAIEEIVVTARKRAETLQTVPITVTAFSGAALQRQGIDGLDALSDFTPGLTIDAFPRTTPRPFIRGIGSSNQSAGADPSSVVFVDGVYYGRGPMLSVDLFDVERLEVLKGPQGTLWGKNVVGGAIHFVTSKPHNEWQAEVQATVAEYDQRDLEVMVNVPVSDRLAARAAVSSHKNDGFRRNLDGGGRLDDEDRLSGRFHLLYQLSDMSDVLLTVDGTRDDTAGPARFNVAPFDHEDVDEPRYANPDQPGFTDRETWGAKLELNSSLSWAELSAYVSYRGLDVSSAEDFDGTNPAGNAQAGFPVPAVQVLKAEEADAYSTEWRLASSTASELSWVAGIYYLHDEVHREREDELAFGLLGEDLYAAKNVTDSFAAFGEARYELGNRASAFAGLRYTDETKEYEIRHVVGAPSDPEIDYSTFGNPGTTDEQQVTWRAGLDHRVTAQVFLFGSISTGFKSGAFQEQPVEATARRATDPEEVVNYEVGVKTELMERRLRANASIFQADYSNLQTIQLVDDASAGVGGSRVVTDSGDATIRGVETELDWVPGSSWRLYLRYTYLDATFDEFVETQAFLADGAPVIADLGGNRLSRTPEHAAAFGGEYRTGRYDWGAVALGVDVSYRSDIFDDNSNNGIEVRDDRTLLDAYVDYLVTDTFSLKVWGRNLTDETYRVHQAEIAGGHFVQYGAPRQLGVTFTLAL